MRFGESLLALEKTSRCVFTHMPNDGLSLYCWWTKYFCLYGVAAQNICNQDAVWQPMAQKMESLRIPQEPACCHILLCIYRAVQNTLTIEIHGDPTQTLCHSVSSCVVLDIFRTYAELMHLLGDHTQTQIERHSAFGCSQVKVCWFCISLADI